MKSENKLAGLGLLTAISASLVLYYTCFGFVGRDKWTRLDIFLA